MMTPAEQNAIRIDLQIIADMIEPGTRLLDVGCGNGMLLDYLVHSKQVDGRGIELSSDGVRACVSAGLSVIQGDADTDLTSYPNQAFDYVVLSQTLQTVTAPRIVLENMLRIGQRAIVSFPNFAYWRLRLHLAIHGQMPVSNSLPYHWYDTPNIHLCTIKDFLESCEELGVTVERSIALNREGQVRRIQSNAFLANLFGVQAVFLLKK